MVSERHKYELTEELVQLTAALDEEDNPVVKIVKFK